MHIRVRNADGTVKFTLRPVRLVESSGMKTKDPVLAEALVEENE
ncbi:DUF4160 domain-containing protein [Dyadobacter bucti]|nr:DUF4160 domain-containing protein [Dyadobacter bucti]